MQQDPRDPISPRNEPNTTLKVVVLLVLIALLVVGILLPIKLVPNAFSTLGSKISNLFGGNASSTATLSTDKTDIVTGQPFTISWTGTHRTDGTYVLSYNCQNGVQLVTSVNQPNENIICGAQYYFSPQDNSVSLTPFVNHAGSADTVVSLSFLANGGSEPQTLGSLDLTISNPNGTQLGTGTTTPRVAVTPTPAPSPAPTPSGKPISTTPKPTHIVSKPQTGTTHRVSNPYGTADLSVRIMNVGYLSPISNRFVASPFVHNNERAAVKFIVTNLGTKNTGSWSFTASLPTAAHPTYTAYNLPNIAPGDSIIYELGFDNINNSRNNTVIITVDPQNQILELTKTNNSANAQITNLDAGQYYQPQPNYYY